MDQQPGILRAARKAHFALQRFLRQQLGEDDWQLPLHDPADELEQDDDRRQNRVGRVGSESVWGTPELMLKMWKFSQQPGVRERLGMITPAALDPQLSEATDDAERLKLLTNYYNTLNARIGVAQLRP